jgi:Uma2 family endonuclease
MTARTMPATETSAPPPLRHGDRLTRAEFERRYANMPDVHKAELIEGVVHMPPPVTHEHHGAPHFDLITWLGLYRTYTPGVRGGDNSTLRLDPDNGPQPDAYLIILPTHGGQARLDADGYLVGAPELVAEVAASSVNVDLGDKLAAYQRNGVREYLVWRVHDREIDWFVLRDGRYDALVPGANGWYRSEVLPGLWLDAAALIAGDLPAVLGAVQQGIASPAHAAFVDGLRRAAAGNP